MKFIVVFASFIVVALAAPKPLSITAIPDAVVAMGTAAINGLEQANNYAAQGAATGIREGAAAIRHGVDGVTTGFVKVDPVGMADAAFDGTVGEIAGDIMTDARADLGAIAGGLEGAADVVHAADRGAGEFFLSP